MQEQQHSYETMQNIQNIQMSRGEPEQNYATVEQAAPPLEYLPSAEPDPQQYERNNSYQQGYNPHMPPPSSFNPQNQQYPSQYVPPAAFPAYLHFQEVGSDGKILAAFSYMGFWLTGLIMLLFVRENRFIRFHALQSLLFFGAINVIYVLFVFFVHGHMPFFFAFPVYLGFILANIIGCVGWFVGIFSSFSGKFMKLPFIGDFAERYVNGGQPLVK